MKYSNKFALGLMAILFLSLYSCSDDDDYKPNNDQSIENKYFTGNDLTTEYRLAHTSNNFNEDPFSSLGYGYDITSKYAHPDGIRSQVIHINKVNSNKLLKFDIQGKASYNASGKFTGTSNDIKKSFLTLYLGLDEIDVNEKYKNAFNDIFNVSFQSDTTFQNLIYYYYLESYNTWYKRCSLDIDPIDPILNSLSDTFLQDVSFLSPDSIIKKYGTHVMTDIIVGWRRDYYYRSTSNQNIFGRKLGAMEKVLGSSTGLGIYPSNKEDAINEKENLYTEYVGGLHPQEVYKAWMFDVTNYSNKIKYEYPEQTFDSQDLVLIDWGTTSYSKPLIPIYEFVTDQAKREALKKAFEDYLSK